MLFKTFGLVFFLVSKFIFVFEIEIGKKPQIDRRIKNNKKRVLKCSSFYDFYYPVKFIKNNYYNSNEDNDSTTDE